MLRNRVILLLLICLGNKVLAQRIVFNATTFLTQKAETTIHKYSYNGGTGFSGYANIRAGLSNLPSTIPLGAIGFKGYTKSSALTEALLSTTYQSLASGGGFIGSNGYNFDVDFSIKNLSSYAWSSGEYKIPLEYESGSSWGVGGGMTVPADGHQLTIEVPEIAAALLNTAPKFEMEVSDFSFFRNNTLTTTYTNALLHTVNLGWTLRGSKDIFDFSNGYSGLVAPVTSIGRIKAQMGVARIPPPTGNGALNAAGIIAAILNILAPASQRLDISPVNLAFIPVGVGNCSGFQIKLSISPEDLRTGFINSGTYRNQLIFTASGGSKTSEETIDLNIVTPDMQEMIVLKKSVDLSFNSVNDYSNGISVDVPNQLQLSKTRPYDLSVRAESANFSSGTENFPVSVLGIGPASGQTGVNNISSMSTQNQILISGAAATVDRNISLRYTISATAANELITKKKNSYSNNLIFTLAEH